MADLKREIENYILPLHEALSKGDKELTEEVYDILKRKIKVDKGYDDIYKLAMQTIAQFGIKAAIAAVLNENKTNDDRVREAKNFIQRATDGKANSQPIEFDKFVSFVKRYHMNFMNKWVITFGNNKVVESQVKSSEIPLLMQVYTSAVSLPSIVLETNPNPLTYTRNEDISNVDYGEFSITMYLDANMLIYKTLIDIVRTMRDNFTGRYGYREDYRFDNITIDITDNNNNNVMSYDFTDCIIKSISDVDLTNEPSSLKSVTITFIYDRSDFVL